MFYRKPTFLDMWYKKARDVVWSIIKDHTIVLFQVNNKEYSMMKYMLEELFSTGKYHVDIDDFEKIKGPIEFRKSFKTPLFESIFIKNETKDSFLNKYEIKISNFNEDLHKKADVVIELLNSSDKTLSINFFLEPKTNKRVKLDKGYICFTIELIDKKTKTNVRNKTLHFVRR